MAIKADPTWREHSEDAGKKGMSAARSMALLSYRSYDTYKKTQSEDTCDKLDSFKAISYQQYQGEKLVRRFNAHTYLLLTHAMDSHNVGRNRGGVENALALVKAKTLVIGISSDVLFPVCEQQFLAEKIKGAKYAEIDSLYGHDGFLIEVQKIETEIRNFYSAK
jgi:homoserine O-acetyltransferase/O-succinyltransferase